MPICFKCQHCETVGELPDSKAGQLTDCPECGGVVDVPPLVWATPQGSKKPLAKSSTNQSSVFPLSRDEKASIAWWLISGVSAGSFLFTIRTPDGPLVMLHYIGLMVAVAMLTGLAGKRLPLNWSRSIGFAAAIFAAYLWGRSDYSMNHWSERTENNLGEAHYVDYKYRGHDRPFYREFWITWDDGSSYHAEGGFSESGKQHGKWHSYRSGEWIGNDEWYWYGEPITEGEWHLRNR